MAGTGTNRRSAMYIDSERFAEMVKGLIPDSYENDYEQAFVMDCVLHW